MKDIDRNSGLEPTNISRRDFLKLAGIFSASLGLGACGVPLSHGETPTTISEDRNTIRIDDEILPIKEGEGPAGTLMFFTDPAIKFGNQHLEHHPELIEQSALYFASTDGKTLDQYPISLISSPVWTPDGKFVAVHAYKRGMQGDYGMLLVLTADGELALRTDTPLSPAEFVWSPDKTSLFYTSRFYLARTLGDVIPQSDFEQMQNPNRLPNWLNGVYRYILPESRYEAVFRSNGSELCHNPSPSPDGSMIAFTRHTYSINYDVMIADIDSPDTPRIVDSERSLIENPDTRIQWSPDGKQLYYVMDHGIMAYDGSVSPENENTLHIIDLESGQKITRSLPGQSYVLMTSPTRVNDYYFLDNLDLSSDGSIIAHGSSGKITLMDKDGIVLNEYLLPSSITQCPDDVRLIGLGQIGFSTDNQYYVLDTIAKRVRKVEFADKTVSDTGLRFTLSSAQ